MLNQMKKQFDIIYKRYHLAVLKDLFDRAQIGYVGPTFAYYALLTIFPTIMSVVMLISITNVNQKDMIAVVSSILPQNIQVIVICPFVNAFDTFIFFGTIHVMDGVTGACSLSHVIQSHCRC